MSSLMASTLRRGWAEGIFSSTPQASAKRCISKRFIRARAGLIEGACGAPTCLKRPPSRIGFHSTVVDACAAMASMRVDAR